MEQMFDYCNIQSKQQVKVVVMHLEGVSLQCYRWLLRTKRRPLLWGDFERGLMAMYDEQTMSDYSEELSKLKQEGYNYDHYQTKFMRFSYQVPDLPENYLISCFISGLREAAKYEHISKKPSTMIEARRLAKVEEKAAAIRKSQRPPYTRGNQG